ncbi:WD repeat domain 85 [Seminavis robusta]|uniref:WD repeat domain 85 n=1 Tax=Seminavis robusta TaxID=568900 RepID=A0A9N8DWZ5_9STRA|nr:WD repeat domain 85 [Seminavis robusta]|eukprot:Sro309_g113850.1 WD repeat domain 85 (244) ;mRNA; f:48882-49613
MSTVPEGSTPTVRFNVGGTKYEISRSLLSQHQNTMLARIASETWQKDPQSEIFVERDGGRFKFVLDFMRDGQVILPAPGQVSKESLLNELAYFGFDNVDPSRIKVEFAHLDAPRQMMQLTEEHNNKIEKLYSKREKLNIEIAANVVAHACCVRHMTTGKVDLTFDVWQSHNRNVKNERTDDNHLDFEVYDAVLRGSLENEKQEKLDELLAKYGLRGTRYEESRFHYLCGPSALNNVQVSLSKL